MESGSHEAKDKLCKFEKLMVGLKLTSDEYSPSELVSCEFCIDQPNKDLTLQQYDEIRTFIFDHLDVQKYIAQSHIKSLLSSSHLEW